MIVRWILLALLVPAMASSQETTDPVQRVADALNQGALAEQSGDPKAMAEAARTLDLLGAKPVEGEENAASRWRDLAKAGGVKDSSQPYRGRALGPAYRKGVLAPRATLATEQIFLAGKKAVISVVPETGRTLAMSVTTPGQAICAQDVAAPRGVCSWLPVFTRRVEIRLVNQGDLPSHYYLVSN